MRSRRARAYFISDLDGRNAAVLAVTSIRQLLEVVPTVETRRVSILDTPCEAQRVAMARPGQLFVRPLLTPSREWRPTHSRHPAYPAP